MKFKHLTIQKWKQFQNLDLEFHPRLTILTGANGSGKTTILNILARHFGWDFLELSTPILDDETGGFRFLRRSFDENTIEDLTVGQIIYENGNRTDLYIKDDSVATYHLHMPKKIAIPGINIPAHRYTFHYTPISNLSTAKTNKKMAHDLVSKNHAKQILHPGSAHGSPGTKIKETLLNWAVFGYGNKVVEQDQERIASYEGFVSVLKNILPETIGFRNLVIRKMEVVFVTDSGEFLLDAVSGGIGVLIDLVWQIFTFQTEQNSPCTVLIDEVENHLHPAMQRSVLANLMKAFPTIQFIVSTHSPLVIGSEKESSVYALRYNEQKRVFSEKLDLTGRSRSATDILREVLGVPFSMPIWVEEQLNEIIEKYSSVPFEEGFLSTMRQELNDIGLSNLAPHAIMKVVENIELAGNAR